MRLKTITTRIAARVIFGNDEKNCPGLGVVRNISTLDDKELKKVIKWHFDYEEYAEEQLMDHYYDTEYGCIYI